MSDDNDDAILDSLDWSRLRAGQYRALNPDNQWAFDALRQQPAESVGGMASFPVNMPSGLHPDTQDLVLMFAWALAKKLHKAELKYGYDNGWKSPDWMDECRGKLLEHLVKGDPIDVAAYCAFLWHHEQPTVKFNYDGNNAAAGFSGAMGKDFRMSKLLKSLQFIIESQHLAADITSPTTQPDARMALEIALEAADKVRLQLSKSYRQHIDDDTSQMQGNIHWAELKGSVATVDAIRALIVPPATTPSKLSAGKDGE